MHSAWARLRAGLLGAALLAGLSACAAQQPGLASAPRPDDTTWAFEGSDLPLDPGYRFGRLPNGMRYIVRANANPKGTALVRLDFEVGSLDEADSEQGFAHFVEHMAFNGSTKVPEGEMIKLLERKGLAFGADTNASTSFDRTVYKLDLPETSPDLIDTALMLMRETASELTISQEAVDRERGVVLSEMRDRNSYGLRDAIDSTRFFYPGARYGDRFPIGTAEALQGATADSLRAFYTREYVPSHATLVIVGDFDADKIEDAIRAKFESWQPAAAEPQPDAGPVSPKDKDRTAVYLDPALSERVTVMRHGPWRYEPDSVATRQQNLLRTVGYNIVNRRLQRVSRQEDPPFRGAGFGTGDVFEAGRSTRLIVDSIDGKWQRGVEAAGKEYRRALDFGFTAAEVAEQVANLRTSMTNAAASADTRSNGQFAGAALALVQDRDVPSSPQSALARFEAFAPRITPEAVLAAMKDEALPLKAPLIRFSGRVTPAGGEKALRQVWKAATRKGAAQAGAGEIGAFAYTDFGTPGTIVSDAREPLLGIRQVRFANGVMLNLKRTDLEKDKVRLTLAIDGGESVETKADPLVNELVPYLDEGGLGKHSADDLQSLLAGRTAYAAFSTGEASYNAGAVTTPRDLELQLELLAAYVTDPGYRAEAEVQYRQQVNNYFAQLGATPGSALQAGLGGILSGGDPRFTLQDVEAFRALTFAKTRSAIADRFAKGAMELGVVGDIDEDQVIALVARTFGALPARETAFRGTANAEPRTFTADRSPRVLRHTGPADQATLRLIFPTRDDADPVEALTLSLLDRVAGVALTDQLREELGKAYSPGAFSGLSRYWKGYGTFTINASVDVKEVPATREAIRKVLAELRDAPVSADMIERARQPMLESLANALKTNDGWLSLTSRAQSENDRIARYLAANERLKALTPADVQAMARRYLTSDAGVEVLVLPQGAETAGK